MNTRFFVASRWRYTFGLLGSLFSMVLAFGEAQPGSNRVSREIEGVTYTFSPSDEALVRALAPLIATVRQKQKEGGAHDTAEERRPFTATDLHANKDDYLRQIASSLGLEAPTVEQVRSYDTFIEMFEKVAAVGDRARKEVRDCPVVVWQKPELITVLKNGASVPGFKLADGGEMVEFSWSYAERGSVETPMDKQEESNTIYGYNSVAGGDGETRSAFVTLNAAEAKGEKEIPEPAEVNLPASLPIVVKSGETPEELVRMVEGLLGNLQHLGVVSLRDAFVLLHEAVEIGIVEKYLVGEDRRWLCDGVANYVAWKIIRDRAGTQVAREAYDLDGQLDQWESHRKKVNFRRWKVAEQQGEKERESDLNKAHYAFATRAVFLMVERNGEEFLPRLFREIGKTPRDKTTMRTVEKA